METLAEPGLLPHGHYPMAMNGYYSKQDAPSYYYHHSSTNRPPHNYNYTGYAPAPQGETRPGDQMYSPTDKYPAHDSDKPAQFHHYPQELQPHPYQHQIPDASSVYFPHNNPNIGSSHKDKTTPISDPNSSDVEGSESSFTEEKPNTKNNVENQNIPERKLTPRVPQDISVNLDKLNAITSPGEHNANSDSEEVLPPPSRDQRSLYYRHQNQIYHEEMQQAYYNQTRYMHGRGNVKDNYMMYGQKEPTVIKSEIDPDNNWHSNNRQNEKANPQFTERLALQTSPTEVMRSMSVQRKDYHGVSMNPIYHMEAMNNFYNYNHKADTITSVGRWDNGETITAGGRLDHKTPFPGLLHDRQKNPEVGTPNKLINNVRQHLENTTSPTSLHNRRMMSPEKYPRMAYHQSLDLQSKPRLLEGMLSPSKISSELKQHYQHHPNLYSPSAGKPSILPPLNTQHQHHNTTLQQPPWNPPVLPGSLRPKTPKETEIPVKEIKNTELPESNLSDQDDRKESPESDKASSKTEETNGSPSATSASGDKMTSGDKDDSVVAKKEVLSDDGCDEISPYPGSRARSPMSPPSPDAPMTYPPHFPHPFFASPPVGQRLQFGSPKGHHDPIATSGFPFGKDFGGRFPIPGLTPDMGLHGSPFMRPLPTNFDSLGKSGEDKDIFFCHLCSYSGKSKSEFDSHMNIHFEFNCPHCDYTSRTEGRLKRHIKDFHSDDSSRRSMPGRPKVYKCKQCQFSTTEKDKFWEHARTHIKEDKLLQCPNCPFVTEYKHHLEYHLRNHFNSKPFKCNKCNYSCVNKSMLNSHMKSHTNVYQYRCSNCTYATKYCHSLKLHLRKYNHKPATVLNQDGSLPQGLDAESSGLSIVAKRGPPRGPRCPKKDKNDPYLGQLFGMPPMGINTMLHGMMPFWPMLSHVGLPGHPSPQAGLLTNMGDFTRQNQLPMDDEDSSCHVIGNGDNSSDSNTSQTKDEEILPVPVNNKETPLDLTKPKSVSPTTFSNPNSPRKLDSDHEDNHVQDRSPHRSPESDNRKRPFENPIPSAPTQETSSRKRSRKGKAYKLDTFCMKLQEKQSSSNILDSDEQDSDMEINFERFQPLQSALKDKVVEEEETCFKRLDSVEEITTTVEGNDYKKDDDDDDTDRERSDAEDTDEYEVKNDETEIISQFKDKQDEINHAEKLNEEKTENDSDEESDFEKLQRVLNIINNEPEDSKIKPVEVDKIQKEEPAEVQSSEVKLCEKNDPESNTDDSKTDENKTETQLPSNISKGQGEAVDQVDMINTVLQNRKKPLPPAVRRGTELAWKLLHDPVNPVTSLPLPVDSPPILIQSEPVKPSTSLSMQSVITSTVQPNRNVLKHTQPLPYPQRPYPTPHPSQVMMNPPLPLPIPPTPMAFIPPTSHLMPEVPMARPSPKAKMAKPEEYSCTYCGLYFQDCVMYTVHMGYHSNQNPFKCNSCGIVCRDKVEFFLHIARSPHS